MTAKDMATFSDVAEADQDGKRVTEDTELFAIEHPPFITTAPRRAESLHGLKPPKNATSDFKRGMAEVSYDAKVPEVMKEIKYEKQYKKMLNFNPEAEKELFRIKMLLKTRDVCIISGSPTYPYCPRKIVYDMVMEDIGE